MNLLPLLARLPLLIANLLLTAAVLSITVWSSQTWASAFAPLAWAVGILAAGQLGAHTGLYLFSKRCTPEFCDLAREVAKEGNQLANLSELLDSLREVTLTLDPQGRITFLSRSWERMFKYSSADTLGKNVMVFVASEDRWNLLRQLVHLQAGRISAIETELRVVTNNGGNCWCEVFVRPRVSGDLASGFVGSVSDISQRKQAEIALRLSEAHYRFLSENSSDVIARLNEGGECLYLSDACFKVLGYKRFDLLGIPLQEKIMEADIELFEENRARALRDGETSCIVQFVHPSRKEHWVEIQLRRASLAQMGARHELVATLRDVTRRMKTLEELRLRQRAMDRASCGIAIVEKDDDHEFPIILANEVFAKFKDHTGDLIGKPLFSDYAGTTAEAGLQNLKNAMLEERELAVTLQTSGGDHEPECSVFSIAPVQDAYGNISHFIVVQTDVSEMAYAQSEMEKAMQTANRANQSKSEFLAIMSHEIRTPMNSVLGFAELLSDTELEEEQKDFVDLINRNAKSLLNIINDILDFSRIESGRLELEESPMSVEAVALEAIELMRPQSKDKCIEILLEKSLEEPGNYHLGDSLRLRQILLNLLSNAVKFTPEGKVTLHLDASASEEAGKTRFDFAVEDTGVGIPPDRLDSLFQPFGQAERSTSRRFGGSGLGLLISQRLCQFMGGKISVVSEQDEGSTFSFSLDLKIADFQDEEQGSEVAGQPSNEQRESNAIPAKEEEEEATAFEPPRSSDIPVEDTSSPDLSGPRLPILLAEDNPANQMVIRRMLGRLGLNADLASNGSEAVDLWRVHRHPLIFMDLQMPILDGFETVQRIRGLERSESGILKLSGKSGANRTVIVAITANALRGDRQKCLAAGMDDYISKPVKLETFREVISKHFPRILA